MTICGVVVGPTYYVWAGNGCMQMRLTEGIGTNKLSVTIIQGYRARACVCVCDSLESSCWTNTALPVREKQHPTMSLLY